MRIRDGAAPGGDNKGASVLLRSARSQRLMLPKLPIGQSCAGRKEANKNQHEQQCLALAGAAQFISHEV
jgi:hypothetical protein